MRKSTLLAAAAIAMIGAGQPMAAPGPGYAIPNGWSPSSRGGNNRREDSSKRHAKAKAAYKSKRAQRKKAKR